VAVTTGQKLFIMHATRRRTTRTATQKGKAARAIPSEPQPQPQHEPPRHPPSPVKCTFSNAFHQNT